MEQWLDELAKGEAACSDLRNAVLAEHVSKKMEDDCFSVEFDFLRPNCGRRHWAKGNRSVVFFLELAIGVRICVRSAALG